MVSEIKGSSCTWMLAFAVASGCGGEPGSGGSASGSMGSDGPSAGDIDGTGTAGEDEGDGATNWGSDGPAPTSTSLTTDASVDGTADDDGDAGSSEGADDGGSDDTGDPGFEFGPGVFVHAGEGTNGNPGSMDQPLRTIQAGVAMAEEQGLPAVYVAEGVYEATHEDGESIVLHSDLELYGGFSADDWDQRDVPTYETRIVDLSASAVGTTSDDPHRAVSVDGSDIEPAPDPLIDGFTVVAAPAGVAAAVAIEFAQGRFVDNVLLGNDSAVESVAVSIWFAQAPRFEGNTIDTVGGVEFARAVQCRSSEPSFVGNDIRIGDDTPGTALVYTNCAGSIANNVIWSANNETGANTGIALASSTPSIVANTIVERGTAQARTTHIWFGSAFSAPTIDNNNFIEIGLGQSYCLSTGVPALQTEPVDPASLRNNNFGCSRLYERPTLDDDDSVTTMLQLESFGFASGNVQVDPGVVDAQGGDFHLLDDGTAPCEVVGGGLDLSAVAGTFDFDGVPRSVAWSIGAFELDGACF